MTHFIVRLFFQLFWRQINVHTMKNDQRSGSSSLSALKLKSFASLVKWCTAHYTRHMKCHVSLRDLYGLCVNARTDSGKSLAVWMNQNQTIPGQITRHIFHVFSGMAVWKRLNCFQLVSLRSLTRSSRVVLGWFLTVLMIIETQGEILHGAPVRGRLTIILCFFHLRIIAPTVVTFSPSCLAMVF